ncbi:MAG: OmpA family protein [Saprospiraceae bacterium]
MRIFFLTLLFVANALFARWYYVCKVQQLCGASTVVQEDVRLKTLRLMQGDTVLLQGYDQFKFDSASVLPDINQNNSEFLDTVAAYMKLFPQNNLQITGWYRPGIDTLPPGSYYENIGVARANAVRSLLMKRGIAEERISLDYSRSQDTLLREPLTFLIVPATTPSEFEIVQFSFTNMTFSDANFEFDSDVFKPGEAFQLYADSVKTYLNINPDKAMTIIGHTDNIGPDNYNKNLGLRRAQSARQYFKDLGVTAKINVASQGEKRPAATNDSDEGRQKNRRVNFVLE